MSGPGSPRSPRRSWGGRAVWLILIVLVLGGLTLLLWARYPEALGAGEAKAQALQYIGIAALVASGALLGRRVGVGAALRSILAWGGLGVMLILGYGYRDDIALIVDRLRGEPAPTVGQLTGERALTYRASASGHFVVEARVGDVPIRFLVDTGASHVMLSRADARRLGFDPAKLRYTQRFDTANGQIRAAPVTLEKVSLGPVTFDRVRAYVSDGDFAGSLLGLSLLRRFRSYEVRDGTLTLRW
jgi:aspartyl protease family protein